MRLLLDTNIILVLSPTSTEPLAERFSVIHDAGNDLMVSVASIWEIALKTRLGKLDVGMPLLNFVGYVEAIGIVVLPITRDHVLAELNPEPPTRDPFDRLLLAQCQVEGLRLVTRDRVLAADPLAWR